MLKRILCVVLMCFMIFLLCGCDWENNIRDGTVFSGDPETKNLPKSTAYVRFRDDEYRFDVADYSLGGDNWIVLKSKDGRIFKTSQVNVLIIEYSE